jgi:hypothetical protein
MEAIGVGGWGLNPRPYSRVEENGLCHFLRIVRSHRRIDSVRAELFSRAGPVRRVAEDYDGIQDLLIGVSAKGVERLVDRLNARHPTTLTLIAKRTTQTPLPTFAGHENLPERIRPRR